MSQNGAQTELTSTQAMSMPARPGRKVNQMDPRRYAYEAGYRASSRAANPDLDSAEARFCAKHADPEAMFSAGWVDAAVGNPRGYRLYIEHPELAPAGHDDEQVSAALAELKAGNGQPVLDLVARGLIATDAPAAAEAYGLAEAVVAEDGLPTLASSSWPSGSATAPTLPATPSSRPSPPAARDRHGRGCPVPTPDRGRAPRGDPVTVSTAAIERLQAMTNEQLMEALRIARANLARAEASCTYVRPVYRERALRIWTEPVIAIEDERMRRRAAR